MNSNDLLLRVLDFETFWNKYHISKEPSHIYRLEQLVDILYKLEITDLHLVIDLSILAKHSPKNTFLFFKTGTYINHIPKERFESLGYRIKALLVEFDPKKYQNIIDLDLDYVKIFRYVFDLRIQIYRLQNTYKQNKTFDGAEDDFQKYLYHKMFVTTKDQIEKLDQLLLLFLNPFDIDLDTTTLIHYAVDLKPIDQGYFKKYNL